MSLTKKKVVVVGISGATCSGKTTIAKNLNKLIHNSTIFCQDHYFLPVDDPRHLWIPELNHINWDIISSLDMEKMAEDVRGHVVRNENSEFTESPQFAGENGRDLNRINQSQCHVVIVEGFCIFNYKPLANLCDLKYYFTLEFEECFRRRIKRVYEPADVPGYFEKCVWPEHIKQMEEVKADVSYVKYFHENSTNELEEILKDIADLLGLK